MRGPVRALVFVVLALGGACSLDEVTLVDPQDVVVAEAYLQLGVSRGINPPENRMTVFLHRTLGPEGVSRPVEGARIQVRRRRDGFTLELARTRTDRCVSTAPEEGPREGPAPDERAGTCYWSPSPAVVFQGGDTLELRVDLPDGGVLESLSVVPGEFELMGGWSRADGSHCVLPGGGSLDIFWTPSEGAWAYVNETILRNLTQAFAARGVTVDPQDDPLYLLGLSVSATDTTITFPREFGLFDRFGLDQDLATALQDGLPPPGRADITIAAADRNYVNWVRGGNFNPSGQVRVPSIRGDGTGVFGSTVVREIGVWAVEAGEPYVQRRCPGR